MSGGLQTQSGLVISISTTVQNSDLADQAAFDALTYTPIENTGDISNFGPVQEFSEYPTTDAGTLKAKGRFDPGTGNIAVQHNPDLPGHVAIDAAAVETNTDCYAWRLAYPNGNIRYCRGSVLNSGEPGGDDSVVVVRQYQVGIVQNNVFVNAA